MSKGGESSGLEFIAEADEPTPFGHVLTGYSRMADKVVETEVVT